MRTDASRVNKKNAPFLKNTLLWTIMLLSLEKILAMDSGKEMATVWGIGPTWMMRNALDGLNIRQRRSRKTLLGVLLLAKELWKEELSQRPEGAEVMDAIEAAEDSFPDISETNNGKRLQQTMDVKSKRAKSIFDMMSYVSKKKWPAGRQARS